jgi:hypothetical protein
MEWFVLGVSLVFVVIGVTAMRGRSDVAVPTIAFFGVCGAMAASTIVRKRRFARLELLSVEIVGGTPIRPSIAQTLTMAVTVLALGLVFLVFPVSPPTEIVICAVIMVVVGGGLLIGLVTRRLPVGFLQFDPGGLTIGQRPWSFTIPWDSVAAIGSGEFNDNPVLLLSLRDPSELIAHPSEAHARIVKSLRLSRATVGAHVMIMTSLYGIDLPFLVTAIERYVADPEARKGLSLPRLAS